MQTFRKLGVKQTSEDPFEFVLSSATRDRHGDIMEQNWRLANFRKNPIALWGHDTDRPIGTWKFRTAAGQLLGRLELALPGTSEFIDFLRSMVEQRILKATSVGFIPEEMEPIDREKPFNGFRLKRPELLEASLVSVGANPDALSLAKSLSAQNQTYLFGKNAVCMGGSFYEQLQAHKADETPRDSGKKGATQSDRNRSTTMSLSKRIETLEQELVSKKDALTALIEKEPNSDEDQASIDEQVEAMSETVETMQKDLDRLLKAEAVLATKAIETRPSAKEAPEGASDSRAGSEYDTGRKAHMVTSRVKRKAGHFAGLTIATMVKSFVTRSETSHLLQEIHPDERSEVDIMLKAASAPADPTTPAWAANLIQQRWGEFLDLIRDISVYPRVPGSRVDFDRAGQLNFPRNDGRGTLAGDFVAPGAPIPVKQGVIGTVNLSPKSMKVISSFLRETARTSIPTIQSVIQDQVLGDTAELLDVRLTDAGARTAVRPAGYQDATETGAGNINASTGATVATINADTEAMLQRMMQARAGNNAAWLINPLRLISLRNIQDAASGVFVYREELSNGMFMGYPIISSLNLPADVVVLQAGGGIVYANQFAPQIEVSDQATLVMEDTAPDHIVDGGVATTQDVRSMFQIDGVAVKMTLGLDWRITRIGAVQVLTGVAW